MFRYEKILTVVGSFSVGMMHCLRNILYSVMISDI